MPATKKKSRKARKPSVRSLQGLAPLRALIAMRGRSSTPREVHADIKLSFPAYEEDAKTIYKHLNSLVRHGLAKRSRDRKLYTRTKAGNALLASLTIK